MREAVEVEGGLENVGPGATPKRQLLNPLVDILLDAPNYIVHRHGIEIGESDRFLFQLLVGHQIPQIGSIEPSVKHYEAVCMTEIDLLFESVRNSNDTQRLFSSGQWFDANTALRGIFETAQRTIDIIDPYIGNRLFVLLTAKQDGVAVRLLFGEALKPADQQALEDFCRQFPSTRVRKLTSVLHDRFIIIDSTVAYSAGHS